MRPERSEFFKRSVPPFQETRQSRNIPPQILITQNKVLSVWKHSFKQGEQLRYLILYADVTSTVIRLSMASVSSFPDV